MRTAHGQRNQYSSENSLPWKWIGIGIAIVLILMVAHFIGWGKSQQVGPFLTVVPNPQSTVYIQTSETKKREVKKTDNLYTSDYSAVVDTGSATLSNSEMTIYTEKWTELSYGNTGSSNPWITLRRGRAWLEWMTNLDINMKNITASIETWDVVIIEQQPVYSMLYVLRGNIEIHSENKNYTLPAGKKIMIAQSDIQNPDTTLESLTDDIGSSLDQVAIFIAHDGSTILQSSINTASQSGTTLSGSMILTGSLSSSGMTEAGKYIKIDSPTDGSILPTASVTISGKILSNNVKKVTINDKESIVSPVDASFIFTNFPLVSASTDLVVKAYDEGWNRLETEVITVQTKVKTTNNDKLVPTNFGLGDKNYRITSPTENPYRTNNQNITVSWVVPLGAVSTITVNDYKLQKFVPNSSTWYYYANTTYGTMKEWFNLYNIKFFGADGTLLSSQAFTIIKDSWVISGEN